jgi:ATP-dependent exoDNAse (exonuclease V) beta subunit
LAQTEFDHPVALEAGAGTGKTTVLVARILAWCLGHGWTRARVRLLDGRNTEPADQEIARQGLESAAAAMNEIQVRRKGLAVSLLLVLLVLVALSLKIRQINRIRDLESSTKA